MTNRNHIREEHLPILRGVEGKYAAQDGTRSPQPASEFSDIRRRIEDKKPR